MGQRQLLQGLSSSASLLRPIRPWKEGGREEEDGEGRGRESEWSPDSGVMTSAVTSQEFKKGKIPIHTLMTSSQPGGASEEESPSHHSFE